MTPSVDVIYRIQSLKIYRVKCETKPCHEGLFAEVKVLWRDETYVFDLEEDGANAWKVTDDGLESLMWVIIDEKVDYLFKAP